ncbi:hypothetical protein IAT40_002718 [Kwoniella sp. CBS 6097]
MIGDCDQQANNIPTDPQLLGSTDVYSGEPNWSATFDRPQPSSVDPSSHAFCPLQSDGISSLHESGYHSPETLQTGTMLLNYPLSHGLDPNPSPSEAALPALQAETINGAEWALINPAVAFDPLETVTQPSPLWSTGIPPSGPPSQAAVEDYLRQSATHFAWPGTADDFGVFESYHSHAESDLIATECTGAAFSEGGLLSGSPEPDDAGASDAEQSIVSIALDTETPPAPQPKDHHKPRSSSRHSRRPVKDASYYSQSWGASAVASAIESARENAPRPRRRPGPATNDEFTGRPNAARLRYDAKVKTYVDSIRDSQAENLTLRARCQQLSELCKNLAEAVSSPKP